MVIEVGLNESTTFHDSERDLMGLDAIIPGGKHGQ